MITLRPAHERGHAQHGWLDSFHTFSFADYHDPAHMGFRALRVINEDRVEPGRGFGTHPHRDMEILSYVLEGSLGHRDSMGNGSTIVPGDVQRMSAGTGVLHSEMNASRTEGVHFLQIWILPSKRGIAPGYEQRSFSPDEKRGRLRLVASPDGADGSVVLTARARLHAGLFAKGERTTFAIPSGHGVWVHVAKGTVEVAGRTLSAGDALSAVDESEIEIVGTDEAEVLVFDLE